MPSKKKRTLLYGGRGQNLFDTCPMFTIVFLFPHNLEYFLRPYSMKFSISCNKVLDLTEKISEGHRVFINSPLEKFNLSLGITHILRSRPIGGEGFMKILW